MIQRKTQTKKEIPFYRLKKYLADLVQAEERVDYKAGQMIFYQGHMPYGIYVLRKGRVRFFTKNENEGEALLKVVESAQILDEEAFVQNKPFAYGAKAETDVSISFFSRVNMTSERGVSPKKSGSK